VLVDQNGCADISGYILTPAEAGWDVSGHIGREDAKAERGSRGRDKLLQYIRSCIDECNDMRGCAGFALNVDQCWFKDRDMMASTPEYKGESSKGWIWLYAKQGVKGL
jgi:hypothetical protein